MIVLADLSILEKGFSNSNDSVKRTIINILFNTNVKFCLNQNFIDKIEKEIKEKEYFQAFIKELHDDDRIVIEKSNNTLSFKDQFIEIAINSNTPLLIPLTLIRDDDYFQQITNLIIVKEAFKKNKYWLALELLSKNNFNLSFSDFINESEIEKFFEDLFCFPKYIREIGIFNREQNHKYLGKIKGRNIKYYTLLFGGLNNSHLHTEIKKDLQKELGGKLKLFYTGDKRIIHERKIIFENIIVTLDNSFENLSPKEPTWEIYVTYDPEKAIIWNKKCVKFRKLNN